MNIDAVLTSKEDPTKLFDLIEELAVGSYGHVYKVRSSRPHGESVTLPGVRLSIDPQTRLSRSRSSRSKKMTPSRR
jgi:hypothetical protein